MGCFSYTQNEGGLKMICPYPTKCIYDKYYETGRHLCTRVRCAYPEAQEAAVRREIAWVEEYAHRNQRAAEKLFRLKKELREILRLKAAVESG